MSGHWFGRSGAIALLLALTGCQAPAAPPVSGGAPPAGPVAGGASRGSQGSAPGLPNPADEKCLRDGYQVQPIVVNGIPTDSECVNPATGKRCRSWAYFRGECRL